MQFTRLGNRMAVLFLSEVWCRSCEQEYSADQPLWMALSGAVTVYTPMDHRPDWYWEEIFKRRGMSLPLEQPETGYEEMWLDRLFGEVQTQFAGCSSHGGRYWEITLDLRKLFQTMVPGSRYTLLRLLSIRAGGEARFQTAEDLPAVMRLAVCVPFSCNDELLVNSIFPDWYAPPFMGKNAARKLGKNSSFQDLLQVQELADWSSLNIDFAIAGFAGCGTQSLFRNLNQHPEIVFSTFGTRDTHDPFFQTGFRLLPFRSQVESYNAQFERMKDEKQRSSGFRPRLVGINDPSLFASKLAMQRLYAVQAKMALILCDPLGRLEKHFLTTFRCDDLEAATWNLTDGSGEKSESGCFQSAESLLSEKDGKLKSLWKRVSVAQYMPTIKRLFSKRISLVHQEQLRENSQDFFNSLSKALGGQDSFPQNTSFRRYNSRGGNRTDLCHNFSLVRKLQELLEPEYQIQEQIMTEAGWPIPEDLRRRVTRCDRGEADATYCPNDLSC